VRDLRFTQDTQPWIKIAVAFLLERPELLERIFITKQYQKSGVYRLRLYQNGMEQVFTIDDYIPCSIINKQPLVGTILEEGCLWLHLILKAYAKMCGTYDSILKPRDIF